MAKFQLGWWSGGHASCCDNSSSNPAKFNMVIFLQFEDLLVVKIRFGGSIVFCNFELLFAFKHFKNGPVKSVF